MNKTGWIIFSVFAIGILAVLVIFSSSSNVSVSNVDGNKIQTASGKDGNIGDHIFGKADSPVTLIEYGDYQCPPCGQAYPILKELSTKYQGQIRFVFRNFPISELHANAIAAASAAEAAGLQNKYWEMHNLLYENQDSWSGLSESDRGSYFESLANQIGLNLTKFKADVITSGVNDKINFDIALGKKAGVDGTPTIFLDGGTVNSSTWNDKTKFASAIDAELTKNHIALPK